jgi:hypothetical protein
VSIDEAVRGVVDDEAEEECALRRRDMWIRAKEESEEKRTLLPTSPSKPVLMR